MPNNLHPIDSRKSERSSHHGHSRAATDSAAVSSSNGSESVGSLGGASSIFSRAKARTKATAARPLSYVASRSTSTMFDSTTTAATSEASYANQALRGFEGVFRIPEPECVPKVAEALTKEQESKYAQMLQHFTAQVDYPTALQDRRGTKSVEARPLNDWERMRNLSRESMLRYLRATKWDLEAAKRRLTETIAWRREYGVDEIDPAYIEPEAKSGKETVLGFDKHCRPLHYMHPHRNDTQESPRQMKYAVWILEACIDMMPPGVEQLALLINFEHKSRNPTSISNAKLMLYILQNHYVERLGVALCINVPWIFKMFWNAIQSFVDPVTKSKCKFDEAIKDEVPLSQLSADFGGELDFTYQHDKYWQDLLQVIQERREQMLHRFLTRCGGKVGASEWVLRGGDEKDEGHAPLSQESKEAFVQQAKQNRVEVPRVPQDEVAVQDAAQSDQNKERLVAAAHAAGVDRLDAASAATNGSADAATGGKREVMQDTDATTKTNGNADASGAVAAAEQPELYRTISTVSSTGETYATPATELNDSPLSRNISRVSNGLVAAAPPPKDEASTTSSSTTTATATDAGAAAATATDKASPNSKSKSDRMSSPPSTPILSKFKRRSHPSHPHQASTGSSVGDPETPLREANFETARNEMKEGFHDFVRGGSHFFKGLKAGVAGVGIHNHHGHRKNGSRSVSDASTLVPPPQQQQQPSNGNGNGKHDAGALADAAGAVGATGAAVALVKSASPGGGGPEEVPVALGQHANGGDVAHAKQQLQQASAGAGAEKAAVSGGKEIKVLYFAGARTAIHKSEESVALPAAPFKLEQLVTLLLDKYRDHDVLGEFERVVKTSKWSVNEEMVERDEIASTFLHGGEEVAIIPPVSGG